LSVFNQTIINNQKPNKMKKVLFSVLLASIAAAGANTAFAQKACSNVSITGHVSVAVGETSLLSTNGGGVGTWEANPEGIASLDPTVGESSLATGLVAGMTTVTWTRSSDGCVKTKKFHVRGAGTTSCSFSPSVSVTNVSCHGGDNGAITVAGTGISYSADNDGLTAGTYSMTVTNDAGCTADITATVTEPSELTASASVTTAILCHGGEGVVTVAATGGTGSYTGTGAFSVTAGDHGYTVTDANGCTASASVTVEQPTAISLSWNSPRTSSTCGDGNVVLFGYDASISVTATGGTPGYTGTTLAITTLASGYTVTVTDANGCTASKSTNCVVDVRCATPGNTTKTKVCRNNKTLCVDDNAVSAQVASGATVGACGSYKGAQIAEAGSFKVYPSPASTSVNVEFTAGEFSAEIVIADVTGRIVATKSVENANGAVSFDVTNVPAGLYIVKATVNGETFTSKFSKN